MLTNHLLFFFILLTSPLLAAEPETHPSHVLSERPEILNRQKTFFEKHTKHFENGTSQCNLCMRRASEKCLISHLQRHRRFYSYECSCGQLLTTRRGHLCHLRRIRERERAKEEKLGSVNF